MLLNGGEMGLLIDCRGDIPFLQCFTHGTSVGNRGFSLHCLEMFLSVRFIEVFQKMCVFS